MTMTSSWKSFFWLAAAYNMLAGLPPVLAPTLAMQSFGAPAPDPLYVFPIQLMGALVTTFGIGYALVAMGRTTARDILILGIIGKWGLCLLLAIRLTQIELPPQIIYAAGGDFLFALGFLIYLMKHKAPAA